MTIDEAIQHCEEVAISKTKQVENGDWEKGSSTERDCIACAEEHRQLAEWLKELKAYKNARVEIAEAFNDDARGEQNDYERGRKSGIFLCESIISVKLGGGERMNEAEKERLIKKDIVSIENRVRHAFNQGYEMGIKESRSKIPTSCEDAISRADARHLIAETNRNSLGYISTKVFKILYDGVDNLPSVTPQQKVGRWEEYYTFLDPMTPRYRCSICQEPMEKILDSNQLVEWWSDYCPNCGAKMEVEE